MQRLMSLAAASVLLWGLADTHGLATEQQQDQQPALDGLREGIQMVEDGDYAAAIEVLEAALIELEADRAAPSEMARSYFYAGVARVFIVGDDEARFAFHEAQQHDPQFRPTADQFPRRVIRLWEEASTMEVEAESLAGGEAAGTLTVITEPAAATVYVAGRPRGETPVEVVGLSAGDQRVTIVKDGYINNSRVLALAPNSAERLSVELTAAAAEGSAAALQEDSEEGGGSGWWKWAALAGGGGAAAFLLLPKNKPPVAGATVSPTGSGMAGVTNYRFDGSTSSDPDNDSLTYSWNFGDGSSGSGVNARHVYGSPGNYSVTLTVSDDKEQATTTRSVTVARNLDGGVFVSGSLAITSGSSVLGRFRATMRLTQNGTTLNGSFVAVGDITGTIPGSGSISSSSDFVCPCNVNLSGGNGGFRFAGTVDNGANILEGNVTIRVATSRGTATVTIRNASFTRQ